MGFDLGNMLFGGPRNVGADLADAGYQQFDPNKAAYAGINPNVGVADNTQDQFRNQQLALMQAMQRQASGQGQTAAGAMMQQGNDQAVRAQAGMAAAGNPQSGGAAGYQAAMGAGNAMAANANQAAQLRAQEAQAGMQGAAGLANQGSNQDLQLAMQNAKNQQAGAQYNSGTQMARDQAKQHEADARNQIIGQGTVQGEQNSGMLGSAIGGMAGVAAMLGSGGIATRPTLAVVGDSGPGHTAGPEAVIPLDGEKQHNMAAALAQSNMQLAHHIGKLESALRSALSRKAA